jgi:hypothetical protein
MIEEKGFISGFIYSLSLANISTLISCCGHCYGACQASFALTAFGLVSRGDGGPDIRHGSLNFEKRPGGSSRSSYRAFVLLEE